MPLAICRCPAKDRFAGRALRRAMIVALLGTIGTGCVQRRLTIRSNPPGALVYVDNYEIGTTPVSTDYIYYGTRKIELVKDGYETLTVKQWIRPPWYELFPLDFVSENVVPLEIRDERGLDFEMKPLASVRTDQLLGRAENLRQGSHVEGFTPPPTVAQPAETVSPQETLVEPK
ncbi:MAG TPA: PEGA domain-containing protein [Pirellulales bacterium]|nr:PEGA domain-containing protein [Pirellulales bacterium]